MGTRGAVFVMPSPTRGQSGPVAVYMTAAGWAAATERTLGWADVVTPDGVVSADEARMLGSQPSLMPQVQRTWRRRMPRVAVTAIKDLRQMSRAKRFERAAIDGWSANDRSVEFVWQRHDVFHRAGFVLARGTGAPLVLYVDAPAVWEAAGWGTRRPGWGRILERLGETPQFRAADIVACVSDEVAYELQCLGVDERRLLVSPCSVDTTLFRPLSSAWLRETLGLGGNFVVGWVGSFRPFHGLRVLLDAAAAAREAIPNISLLLIGDGPERHEVERWGRSSGIPTHVTGTIPHQEIPGHLAAIDVAVLTAPRGGRFHYSPLKLKEYMATGRPIVGPRVGEVARVLRHSQSGLLVDPGNPMELVQALTWMHSNPAAARAMGSEARRDVVRHGTWEARLAELLAALREIR